MRSANDEYLTSRFGRVVHAGPNIGPYIGRNGIPVEDVLELVDEGLNYKQVCDEIPGLQIKDVMACMAYRVRFLRDTMKQVYPGAEKAFVLDENVSYLLLPEIFRQFGQSTSVLAEGLYFQRNSDEHDVWKFTVENGYKAILTQDADFRAIAKKHRGLCDEFQLAAVPKVIMIPHGQNIKSTARLLQRHRGDIMEVIQNPSINATFRVHEAELMRLDYDALQLEAA